MVRFRCEIHVCPSRVVSVQPMDPTRFDALARKLVSPETRRGILTLLVGGGISVLEVTDAAARKSGACQPACATCQTCEKGKCKKKNGRKRCKKGRCQPAGNGTTCATGGGLCQNGVCTCPSGTTLCDDVCVNTAIDARNCGSCGTRCQLNGSCSAGICGCNNGTCMIAGATCCPAGSSFVCQCPPGIFTDPTTCNGIPSCPAGTTACVGPQCQACCPAGTNCDTSTGTCLQ